MRVVLLLLLVLLILLALVGLFAILFFCGYRAKVLGRAASRLSQATIASTCRRTSTGGRIR